ncbi:hypothetical protein OIV19_11515 [Brucella sp. HL-2]|nr:hypothetical protein [Brucella sp. HL-2]MCV9908241.1 hypothetical protein [Brucella sp. HL-2]
MTVLSDYTSGTITLANGSTAVTGTGTLFDVAKFREGDTLQIQNLTAVIASVNSNTSLTLAAPWTGTSLTSAPYRARYLADGARVTAQATTLIELLGNGVLSNLAELGVEEGKVPVGNAAGEYELQDYLEDPNESLGKLAALTLAANKIIRTDAAGNASQGEITNAAAALLALAGAANKLPFFDGANSAALTDLTAFARTILATASGAAMWTALGGTQSLSANGWVKFPNGFIIQWGRNYAADGDRAITFPTVFPVRAAVKFAIAELNYQPQLTRVATIDDPDNKNSIAIRIRNVANGGTVSVPGDATVTWFALGY